MARITFNLSAQAFDFIDRERCFGSTVDSIEALLCERAALLNDLIQLNATGEQLGVEPVALRIDPVLPEAGDRILRVFDVTDHQRARIKAHLRGYHDRSYAIEYLIQHIKYLRRATEDQRFRCAQGMLTNRMIKAS